MLLTISTTARPATDLGFLLHKHPDRVQEFGQSYGVARVFYPEAGEERCTAALMLDVDPVRLVRSRGRSTPDYALGQYVNDRPYAASSLLAGALADVFRTARAGRCNARPELAAGPIPLEITLPALPCRGGPELAHRVFEPLGWEVEARAVPLDEEFPEWGDSATCGWRCAARSGWPTRSTSSTCCCPSWTTPSTTGSPPTRWTSSSARASRGWPRTPRRT
nr:hypothetical protein GCM10020093_041430 [Planobispora longispora]